MGYPRVGSNPSSRTTLTGTSTMDKELTEDRKFTVNVSSPGGCKRVLEIHVPEEELERERKAVIRELRRDLRVPGFRKGKVPETYITKNYAGAVESDAVRNLLPVVYEQAVMKEGLHPLGEPNFENLKAGEGDGLRMEAHIEVRPEVTLEGYKDVRVEAAREEVTDERVNATLKQMREHMATYQDVSREATATDYVVIDYAPYGDDGAPDEAPGRVSTRWPLDSGAPAGGIPDGGWWARRRVTRPTSPWPTRRTSPTRSWPAKRRSSRSK